ncbi:hypothetical protein VB005_10125 [Metarhizium brunneum]
MNFWPIVVPAGLAHRRHYQRNFAFVRVVRSGNVQGNFQDSKNKLVVLESILGLSIINSLFSALFLAETLFIASALPLDPARTSELGDS